MFGTARDFLDRRGISSHRAPAWVLARACRLVGLLEAGVPFWQLRGKRLRTNPRLVSIPVGRSWRLLAEQKNGKLQVRQVLSHSGYNSRLSMM